ncbi:BLUF domain-containing protein [Rhodopila sp.]|uniref:BLUF domain-containing protein n=1 Tax=Rhodopila sp. TaxID=2480087 RepID=UPI003D0B7A64
MKSRTGSLYRLIYCSRNVIDQAGSAGAVEQEVRAILEASRRNNAVEAITGALLFTASGFAQVLEGPRDVVERTFERISGDPRHADLTVLSFTPTERRSFPDWSMGCSGQVSASVADPLLPLLADTHSAGPRATTGSDVLHLLEKVVQREDEWISA